MQGSDHCPVYAVFKDEVTIDGKARDIRDAMNPPGMYQDGMRVQEWSTKNLLPTSGKLITEFDRRKNIRDMFSRKPNLVKNETSTATTEVSTVAMVDTPTSSTFSELEYTTSSNTSQETSSIFLSPEAPSVEKPAAAVKRPLKNENPVPPAKRTKSGQAPSDKNEPGKGQQSLKGFFKPKLTPPNGLDGSRESPSTRTDVSKESSTSYDDESLFVQPTNVFNDFSPHDGRKGSQSNENSAPLRQSSVSVDEEIVDPIVSKESWSKLFNKPPSPRCESHNEPCTSYVTKKPGINCGRSFWLCPRPLGPSGNKEKGTQWRCPTFIWASDWNSSGPGAGG
jgi:AP endonuclease-2